MTYKNNNQNSTSDFTRFSFINEIQIYVHTLSSHEWDVSEKTTQVDWKRRKKELWTSLVKHLILYLSSWYLIKISHFALRIRHFTEQCKNFILRLFAAKSSDDCLTHDLHFLVLILASERSRKTRTTQIMFVNKTVYLYENGNFYEAGSQHAGSLNIRTNTEKSLVPYRTVITEHTYISLLTILRS